MKFSATIGNVYVGTGGIAPAIELKSSSDIYFVTGESDAFESIFRRLFAYPDDATSKCLITCLFLNRVEPLYAGDIELENDLVAQLAGYRSI
jgi:hypothetical protein